MLLCPFFFESKEKMNDFIERLLFISALKLNENLKINISLVNINLKDGKLKFIFDDNSIDIYFIKEDNKYGLLFKSNKDLNLKNIFFKIYIELYCENNKYLFTEEYKSLLEIYLAEV